ncbi:transferrin-binding protein-like solute binding protein [Sphingomonas sp. LY54]|uniref:transferrin-binding protein-like solute binding protein n=1 Tax=Sphingomonas sp. LY54 TaxID=3095343 RepID=UPI002D76CFB9|nr:transferrin-binding protein-like solute binding protein [Sphingomonas sp. LY54]WRP27880.1 transferrin-binding protein-like solute binding protein [Sphingomonas sp. LY54]
MFAPIVSAAMLGLAACGGGGTTGGVGTTPAPPPATPSGNTTLTNLQVNQSFTNDAARNEVTWDLATKTGISGRAAPSAVTISYDAAAKTYTVAAAGNSRTFGQGDIATNDRHETAFRKEGGAVREYLTLIKTPYTSQTATQFVGTGYWQRNSVSGTLQDTEFTIFTYGLPTASAAVPRSGTARFDVNAFGMVSAPGEEPRSFDGSGAFSVDFAAGIFSSQAYLTETQLVSGGGVSGGGIELISAGRLSASAGSFSGNVRYGGWFGEAFGSLNGRFYGPTGQELGASFAGSNPNGMTVAGAFTGQRNDSVPAANLTLTNMRSEHLFYTRYTNNHVGQLNWKNSETFTFAPPTSDLMGGLFAINDKVASGDPNFTTYRKSFSNSYETQDVTLKLYRPGDGNRELALTYASFGHWSTNVAFAGAQRPVNQYFAYGLETPARLLRGRTGTGRYQGVVYGSGSDAQAGTTFDVRGSSIFNVDFGAQTIAGALTMAGTPTTGAAATDFGSFEFSGRLPGWLAGTELFLTRGGQTVGALNTYFYGPDGEEIAGPFYLNILRDQTGAMTSISGVTAARRQ